MNDSSGLVLTASRQFTAWLAEQGVSLAVTTYQSGKLFLIGLAPDGRLSVFERSFNRCMGLWGDGQTLLMSSLYQVWRFENSLVPGERFQDYDRLYVPRLAWTTGDLDIHEIAPDRDGRPVFVNTLFGCIATVSQTHSFRPLWRPPFLSRLVAEDRCHLNGLAMDGGEPAFASMASRSDAVDGWRDRRRDGGLVMDVRSDETVIAGLSMPHSPRWHGGRLWLLEAGSGRLGWIDRARGRFEPVAFCPGFLRGMALHGDFAVVGTSQCREDRTFQGLPLDEELGLRAVDARCALHVVDLRSGEVAHWLRFEGVVRELFDVAVLPGVRRPMALGFRNDQIRRMISVEE